MVRIAHSEAARNREEMLMEDRPEVIGAKDGTRTHTGRRSRF